MTLSSNEKIYEELREIGKDLRSSKYISMEQIQMGVVSKAEERLLKTMSEEQEALYSELDKSIWDYVELAEKEAFYHGFQIAKAILTNK